MKKLIPLLFHTPMEGAQWLSGRVLDSRLRGPGFEPCCALQQDINPSLELVQPRKTHPYITGR